MSVERELLERICAEPSKLDLRPVYADRLLEKGEPRGTFIAQQCELARLDVLDPRYAPLLASTLRLEHAHAGAWLAEVVGRLKLDHHRTLDAVFEGGFLQRVALEPQDVAAHWKWLTQREPIQSLELVVVEGLPPDQRRLATPPNPRALKVRAERWVTASSVAEVLAWGMPGLRELEFAGCDLGVAGCQLVTNTETNLVDYFEDFVAPPPFADGQLERLGMRACGIGDQGAQLLLSSKTLSGLRALDLGQCQLREQKTLELLRDAKHLGQLTSISLWGNAGLKGSLGALVGWNRLPHLERLGLPQVTTAAELGALFPKPSKRLRRLELSSAKELAKTPEAILSVAEQLSHLDLGSTTLGDAGWAKLIAAPFAEKLLELGANGCSISDEAIDALVSSKLRSLVELDLSSNKLTDAGLEALSKWEGLEHVARLRIGNNRKVTAAGYDALIAATHFVPARFDIGKSADAALIKRLEHRFPDSLVVG